jgi:hypothetical protein
MVEIGSKWASSAPFRYLKHTSGKQAPLSLYERSIIYESIILKALILAGGLATRLRPLCLTRPKILFPLADVPLIDYALRGLGECGVDTVVMAVNNLADMIMGYLGGERFGLEVLYSVEGEPLGTGLLITGGL